MTLIYALVDPKTKEICYVGQTNNIQGRLRQHLRSGLTASHLESSLWSCRILDLRTVDHRILEICDPREANEKEKSWIQKLWADGHPLLNLIHQGDRSASAAKRIHSSKWWKQSGY